VGVLFGSFGGCSFSGDDDPQAQVRFSLVKDGLVAANDINVTFSDGQGAQTVESDDFQPVSFDASSLWTDPFDTASDGTLDVSFEVNADDKEITSGTVQVELRKDWRWTFSFRADSAGYDPLRECLGCQGARSFRVDKTTSVPGTSRADSMYVVLGGNRISDPNQY